MPIPPWFESIANTLEIPRKERENRYVRLNAELMEIGQRIARERYEEVGFRVTRVSQEKREGGWDFLLVKIMPPAPFTLPDRICLKVRLDTTTIGGQGRECLVLVIAEGDHSWTETFMVPVCLG